MSKMNTINLLTTFKNLIDCVLNLINVFIHLAHNYIKNLKKSKYHNLILIYHNPNLLILIYDS